MKYLVGLDIETFDPYLKERGYSWKYDTGHIICTALYYKTTNETKVLKNTKDDDYSEVRAMLLDNDCVICGANLPYDIGWLLYELHISVHDVKCSFVDVLIAEALLDEYTSHTLESLSVKYLNYGKRKDRVEIWIKENVSAKGDFRKYLDKAPWELVKEYVEGDAANPVEIWHRQYPKLKAEKLVERAKLDFACILPTLCFTINGFPIDYARMLANENELKEIAVRFEKEFTDKYGKVNVGSPKQLGAFFTRMNIPFFYKITYKGSERLGLLKEKKGNQFYATEQTLKREASNVVAVQFHKGVLVSLVKDNEKDTICEALNQRGLIYTCNPSIDAKYLNGIADEFPIAREVENIKLAKGILSKILCESYRERFVHLDKDGVYRIHSQYNICKSDEGGTISGRYSSVFPNNQQIPSKNGLKFDDGSEYSFPAKCRSLFTAESGKVYFKIDYSQVEYRLIVHCAVGEGAQEARDMFLKDKYTDFHQYTVDLTGLSRKYAKNMSFGCFRVGSLYSTKNGISDFPVDLPEKELTGAVRFRGKGFKFELSNGADIVVSENHEFFDTSKLSGTVLAKDVKAGFRLPLVAGERYYSNDTKYNPAQAYIAGLYVGDGTLACPQLTVHYGNADYVEQCLKSLGCKYSRRNEKAVVRIYIAKQDATFLKDFGMCSVRKTVSKEMYRENLGVQLAFVAGLIDSDGKVNKYDFRFVNTDKALTKEVARLFSLLGFDTYFEMCKRKDEKPTEYLLLVYGTNGLVVPTKFRTLSESHFKKSSRRGWIIDRDCFKRESGMCKSNPRLYEYIIRTKRNNLLHNDFLPEYAWQRDYVPVEVVGIKEVEADFYLVQTESKSYVCENIYSHNCSFGMSVATMAKTFGWTKEHAEEIYSQYNQHLPFVLPTLSAMGDLAVQRGYIRTVGGSKARVKDRSNPKAYTFLNRFTQGSGAEILKTAITQSWNEGLWKELKFHDTVHDELGGSVSDTETGVKAVIRLEQIMENAIPLRIPLLAEAEFGTNWYNVKTPKEWLESPEELALMPQELQNVVRIYSELKSA